MPTEAAEVVRLRMHVQRVEKERAGEKLNEKEPHPRAGPDRVAVGYSRL